MKGFRFRLSSLVESYRRIGIPSQSCHLCTFHTSFPPLPFPFSQDLISTPPSLPPLLLSFPTLIPLIRWLNKLVAQLGMHPTKAELKKYVEETLAKGQVVPGYGHGVLRKTDPRYTCQVEGRKRDDSEMSFR